MIPLGDDTIGDGSVWYRFAKTVPNRTVPNGIILEFILGVEVVQQG